LAERLGFVIRYMLSYNKISIVTTSLSYTRRDYPNFYEQSARIPHCLAEEECGQERASENPQSALRPPKILTACIAILQS